MTRTFKGRTEDAESPILGAEFWKKGVSLHGEVVRSFDTVNGKCYEIHLRKPVEFEGKQFDSISVGALTGFRMALSAAGLTDLLKGDQLYLEATGLTETEKGNPRVNFELEVVRG